MRTEAERVPLPLSLAWRETVNHRQFSFWFVFSLALGLTGFLVLNSFKTSLATHLDDRSRAMLGADLGMWSQRPFSPEDETLLLATLPEGSQIRRETTMFSMAGTGKASRLIEIRAIDGAFPFYGTIGLEQAGEVGGDGVDRLGGDRIWIYPELATQLQVQIGDELTLGGKSFKIADVVQRDPAAGGQGFVTAPRVFMGERGLEDTGLAAKGSRIMRGLLVRLPPGTLDAEVAVRRLKEAFGNSFEARIRSHREASEDIHRALTHIGNYLGLVALVALFLSSVGGVYLFRSLLEARRKDLAILLSLGMSLGRARLVYVTQLVILGLAATAVATALALALLPALSLALGAFVPSDLPLGLSFASVALAAAVGIGLSLLACLPFLLRLREVNPAALFQESALPSLKFRARHTLHWVPAVAAFLGLAVLTAGSFRIGALFTGVLFVAVLLYAGIALALSTILARASSRPDRPLAWAMAWQALGRQKLSTVASFVALSLGALLTALIPNLKTIVESELATPENEDRPSLFLFDIQDEQMVPLAEELKARSTPLNYASPMIRARLLEINGKTAHESGDQEDTRSFRRGYNLSYREGLQSSETLVAGRPFSGVYDEAKGGPAELSLEVRFADRMGLGVGDLLKFDVQGVEAEGRVVNLRRVRWTSFQPNFFIQFQPGVLEEAPKTYVAAVPKLAASEKDAMQSLLVERYPNVSIIDVTATIGRILALLEQMTKAVILMAGLTLIAGMTVLYAIARHQAARRIGDVTLLKVLGLSFGSLRLMSLAEFGTLGAAAALTGAFGSVAAAFALAFGLFDKLWVFSWKEPLAVAVALTLATALTGFLAVARSLRVRPAAILKGP
jgi:putative ABC transport system permease protein